MTSSGSDLPPQHPVDDRDRPHKPADDREEVYFQGTPMLRGELGRLFGFGLLGVVLMAVPIFWRAMYKEWWPWWLILGCFILGLAALSIPWLLTRFMHYRVGNYRIDFERGILSKNIDTLELWHVEDIRFHQSLIDRMLGVGTITIVSNDESTPRLELKSLPNSRQLFDQLKQRVIAVKRQRGVIKMDLG
jgi:membrane protein YdbS with pleckstrin-like domain